METTVQPQRVSGGMDRSALTGQFGMVIFLISEAMLFAGLIGGYIVLRLSHGEAWPPEGAPDIGVTWPLSTLNLVMIGNTVVLLGSSVLFHQAQRSIAKGGNGLFWLAATLVAGTFFLGVQAWEWMHLRSEGLWIDTFGIYGSCFFVMTGFHGFHVFVGVVLIFWCLVRQAVSRKFQPGRTTFLDNVGLYWHFVDLVWVVLYTLLYVL